VNHVQINETQREPLRLIPGWVSGLFHHHQTQPQPCPEY
jgi:hypothetical protein